MQVITDQNCFRMWLHAVVSVPTIPWWCYVKWQTQKINSIKIGQLIFLRLLSFTVSQSVNKYFLIIGQQSRAEQSLCINQRPFRSPIIYMHIIWFLLLSIYSPRHKAHGSIAYWIGIRCKTTIRLYCVCTVENESVIEANASAEHCAERIHGTCVYLMRSHSNTIPTGKIRSEKPAHKIKLTSIKNRFNSKFMKMSSDINKYHTKWGILKCKNLKSKVKNRFFC